MVTHPESQSGADVGGRRIEGFDGLPLLIVVGGASPRANDALASTAAFLRSAGALVETMKLADHGIHGNGHGLMFEANSEATIEPILRWLDGSLESAV